MGRRGGGGAGENEAFHCADKWCARLSPLSSPAIAFEPLHQRSARADRHFAHSRLQASSVCTAHSCVQQRSLMNFGCIILYSYVYSHMPLCVSLLSLNSLLYCTLYCTRTSTRMCIVSYSFLSCFSVLLSHRTSALIAAHKKNCLYLYCGGLWRVLSGYLARFLDSSFQQAGHRDLKNIRTYLRQVDESDRHDSLRRDADSDSCESRANSSSPSPSPRRVFVRTVRCSARISSASRPGGQAERPAMHCVLSSARTLVAVVRRVSDERSARVYLIKQRFRVHIGLYTPELTAASAIRRARVHCTSRRLRGPLSDSLVFIARA